MAGAIRKDEKASETAHTCAQFLMPFSGLCGNAGKRHQYVTHKSHFGEFIFVKVL
jgi:hypothetical protein